MVYCNSKGGGEGGGEKVQGGVGLAIRRSVTRTLKHPRGEFISDRVLKVTLELCGRGRAVTIVVVYVQTKIENETQVNSDHIIIWTRIQDKRHPLGNF